MKIISNLSGDVIPQIFQPESDASVECLPNCVLKKGIFLPSQWLQHPLPSNFGDEFHTVSETTYACMLKLIQCGLR